MINEAVFTSVINGRTVPVKSIPLSDEFVFRQSIIDAVKSGMRVSALFGTLSNKPNVTTLTGVLADDDANCLYVCQTNIEGDSFTSMTPECPQVNLFEREIAEQFGLKPLGHPWLKPVRYHHSWTNRDAWDRPATSPIIPGGGDFFRVDGEQVHEVAVGPVHAGIIEPGHFRFQCQGEEVFHLEIALGYQHRGVEKALMNGPNLRSIHYIETLAGDTTIGHTLSYCQALEALSLTQKSARANVLRGIALELERLANHVGDLGALANDVGYLPTASFCGRIRGDFLNLTAMLCGNRFGRGFVVPGGTAFDADDALIVDLQLKLELLDKETADAVNLLWDHQTVLTRFEETGTVVKKTAQDIGLVGPAARASGLARDVRYNHPSGIFRFAQMPVSTYESGDVFARAYVRWLEIKNSIDFIKAQAGALPPGETRYSSGQLTPDTLTVTLNEGWRGEICHVAMTNAEGKLARYKIVDPSFHNWMGLSMALRNQAISDFPLCNKSFNLSYCGHDL